MTVMDEQFLTIPEPLVEHYTAKLQEAKCTYYERMFYTCSSVDKQPGILNASIAITDFAVIHAQDPHAMIDSELNLLRDKVLAALKIQPRF